MSDADAVRVLSRASGALEAVAVSIEDNTANRLDPEKLRMLAADCRAARDELQAAHLDGEAAQGQQVSEREARLYPDGKVTP